MAKKSDFSFIASLATVARSTPDKTALFEPAASRRKVHHRQFTFRQLEDDSTAIAAALWQKGIKKGDHVFFLVPPGYSLFVLVTACLKLGAVSVFADPAMGIKNILHCMELAKPKLFVSIGISHLFRIMHRVFRKIPLQMSIGFSLVPAMNYKKILNQFQQAVFHPRHYNEKDPVMITFTSGSTGVPKGALRTYEFIMEQNRVISDTLNYAQDEIELSNLPLFILNNIANNIASVIPAVRSLSSLDAKLLFCQIERTAVTHITASPALFRKLSAYCLSEQKSLPRITKIFTGGGPVDVPLLKQMKKCFPHAKITVVYGSTEAEPISHIEADRAIDAALKNNRGFCVGKPIRQVKVKILPLGNDFLHNKKIPVLPALETGEIIVTGNHVNKAYYKNKKAEAACKITDVAGEIWHRTGDTGFFDASGRLWLTGRVQDAIYRKNEIFHPFEIEQKVQELDFIERGAAVGMPDDFMTNRLRLVVELKKQVPLKKESLQTKISDFLKMYPVDEILFVKKIPLDKRHNTKILYHRLREM
ncbi:MAG: AMP-binding protein [Spirochaetales bacterium]|nr:AMP-binding protein [Spirochaetales bacterium]